MATNHLTQAALLALTENTAAHARLTQGALLALTENTAAHARLTHAALLVLTDPPPAAAPVGTFGRTATTAQRAVLDAAARDVALSVRIADWDGVLQDYAAFHGVNWITSVDTDESVDQPVTQATIKLRRDVLDGSGFVKSLSPFRTDSICNRDALGAYAPAITANRRVEVWVATTAPGVAPAAEDWQLLFAGMIDRYDVGASTMTLACRDLGGVLADTWIGTAPDFANTSGVPLETVAQRILDAYNPGVTLYVSASPGFMVTTYTPKDVSVLQALDTLAAFIGWDIRYRDESGSTTRQLALTEPPRDATIPDQTVDKSRYYTVDTLALSDLDVRNVFSLTYTDSTTRTQTTVTRENAASIALYGRREMGVVEASDSPIDTPEEADAFLDALEADLADPRADQVLGMAFDWSLELWQLVRSLANGVHYDEDQDYAVVSIKHSLSAMKHRTTLETRGKPAGRYLRWLDLADAWRGADAASLRVQVTPGDASYVIAWSGNNVTLAIDGATPETPAPSPITVVRDDSDHLYEFHGTKQGADTTVPVYVPAAFSAGPELEWSIDAAGNLTVFIDGKPGAVQTYVAVRTDRAPTTLEIVAGQVFTGRTGQLVPGVVIAVGTRFWIGAISETALGQQSKPVWDSDKWLGVGATPVPVVSFGTPTVQQGQISWPVVFGRATQRVDFFVRYTDDDPSPGSTLAPDVENLVTDIFDWFARGEAAVVVQADGTAQLTLNVPLYDGSHWVSVTAVPTDALHQRGPKATAKAQGPGAVIAATPTAPVLSAPTHTSNTLGWTVTPGVGGATASTYRLYVNGALANWNIAVTGGSQVMGLFGAGAIVPSTPYVVTMSAVTAAGIEGPQSNALTIVTDADTSTGSSGTGANGKLPTPGYAGGAATYSRPDQAAVIPFTFASGTPSGMEVVVLSAASSAGPYTETGETATASPALASINQSDVPQIVYLTLVARDPLGAYTDSDPTGAIPVRVPAGSA